MDREQIIAAVLGDTVLEELADALLEVAHAALVTRKAGRAVLSVKVEPVKLSRNVWHPREVAFEAKVESRLPKVAEVGYQAWMYFHDGDLFDRDPVQGVLAIDDEEDEGDGVMRLTVTAEDARRLAKNTGEVLSKGGMVDEIEAHLRETFGDSHVVRG
jgi:hypothetical protein